MQRLLSHLLFLLLIVGSLRSYGQGDREHKISSRYYSENRATVAEMFDDRTTVEVSDVGSTRHCKLTNFTNTVRGVEFYDGNRVLVVSVGGPSAGTWPVFYRRDGNGDYRRFGVNTETALPEEVSSILPKNFEYARMWISCMGWEGSDSAKIRAMVRPVHQNQDYDEPFIFTFNVSSGKATSWLTKPAMVTREAHAGRILHASGTGFYVDWSGLIITAKHVVEHESDIEVVDSEYKRHQAKIVALGADDVALLKVETKPPGIVPLQAGRSVPALGTRLCTMGFPQNPEHSGDGSLELSEGVLSAYSAGSGGRQFQFSAPVRPGNSGGAIIDDTGALMGVVAAGYDPVKVFVKTGYSAVLMNLGEWTDNALLLLPAGWSQADPPPAFHERAEAIKNLQAATVEILLFRGESASPVVPSSAVQMPAVVPVPSSVTPAQRQQALALAQEADRRMTAVYSLLRARLNAAGKAQLKDMQLKWLKIRAAQTGSTELLAKGAAADPEALLRFAAMDEARTAALQAVLQSMH